MVNRPWWIAHESMNVVCGVRVERLRWYLNSFMLGALRTHAAALTPESRKGGNAPLAGSAQESVRNAGTRQREKPVIAPLFDNDLWVVRAPDVARKRRRW